MSGGCSGEDLDRVLSFIGQPSALTVAIDEKGRRDDEQCVILDCESGEEEVDDDGNETGTCMKPVTSSEDEEEDGIHIFVKKRFLTHSLLL